MIRVDDISKERETLSRGKAAYYLGVSSETLRRWEKLGKLSPIHLPGSKRAYYLKKTLEEILQQ